MIGDIAATVFRRLFNTTGPKSNKNVNYFKNPLWRNLGIGVSACEVCRFRYHNNQIWYASYLPNSIHFVIIILSHHPVLSYVSSLGFLKWIKTHQTNIMCDTNIVTYYHKWVPKEVAPKQFSIQLKFWLSTPDGYWRDQLRPIYIRMQLAKQNNSR